jgi:hypothetical protein
MSNQIQSDKELNKFMEDTQISDAEYNYWSLKYAIRNNNTDLLDRIARENDVK